MSRRTDNSIPRRRKRPSEVMPHVRMKWGLSSRLPRWHTFDGRRSRVTPSWAAHDGREFVRTPSFSAGKRWRRRGFQC